VDGGPGGVFSRRDLEKWEGERKIRKQIGQRSITIDTWDLPPGNTTAQYR